MIWVFVHQNRSHPRDTHCQAIGSGSAKIGAAAFLAINAVAKMRRKRAAYAPIRAHYHGMITIFWGSTRRARPRRALGRQLSASSTGSRRRWEAELNSIKDARTKADGPRLDGAATPAGAEEGKVAVNAILELAIV